MKVRTIALMLMTVLLSLVLSCKQETAKLSTAVETPALESSAVESSAVEIPAVATKSTAAKQKVKDYGIATNSGNVLGGLKVGDLAPNFTARSNRGSLIDLDKITANQPVLLTFFRGDWCPYCTKSLAEFQENIKAIAAFNHTRVIAVTPQSMQHARQMANDMGISYHIISDEDRELMEKYKVLFHVTNDYDQKIVKYKGKSLSEFNGDTEAFLPVPATYLIGQDMRIKYVYYNTDYSQRPSVEELLKAIQ